MPPMTAAQVKQSYARAMALMAARDWPAARVVLDAVALEQPNLAEVPFQLGRIALQTGAVEDAVVHLERANALKPGEGAVLAELAKAYDQAGRVEQAVTLFDRFIKADPKALKPRMDKALMLQKAGQFDRAEAEFRKALKRAPTEGQIYRIFLATKKLQKGDPLIGAMRKVWADKSVQGTSRAHLGFALAKAMEDSGQHDQVFRYLVPANAAIHKADPYDIAARLNEVDTLIRSFDGVDFTPMVQDTGFAPIFVAGLPRSGTTLVEQIIASHSKVTGGGEMSHGLRAAYAMLGDPAKGLRPLTDMAEAQLQEFAQGYERAVRADHEFTAHITDKSVQTHLIMGLLRKAIPQAKFVVVRRDPRDVGLSIFKNVFGPGTHKYSYDLNDIAAYIQSHDRMLDFWRHAMPDGFHEVWYEDLVADTEPQTRAMIDAVGLEWEDRCLDFHSNTRKVETLSVHQVRQPIYKSSAKGWKRYEKELAPLITALGLEGKE